MNNAKALQYWIHRNYKDIRSFILAVVLIFFAYTSLAVRADNRKALEGLDRNAQQIKTLAKANKQLNQQNNELSAKNQRYIKCVATIFANYTHNFVPINIKDLDTCTITDGNTSDVVSSTQSNASGGLSAGSSLPNSAPNSPPAQQDNSQQPTNQPSQPKSQGLIPDSIPILGRL